MPTHLVESFKSTLDEVREADLLLHVVDISHPNFEEQIEVVNKTLLEIDKEEKPTILISSTVYGIEELLERIYTILTAFGYEVWMSHKGTLPVFSSNTAFEGESKLCPDIPSGITFRKPRARRTQSARLPLRRSPRK